MNEFERKIFDTNNSSPLFLLYHRFLVHYEKITELEVYLGIIVQNLLAKTRTKTIQMSLKYLPIKMFPLLNSR